MDNNWEKYVSINKEKTSPYWMVSFRDSMGKYRRRSTKVPHRGGVFEGQKITAKVAERLALKVGLEMANRFNEKEASFNNISVRQFLSDFLRRWSRNVSLDTARNGRGAFEHFCEFLGVRQNEPLRLVTKADFKEFVSQRREVVRARTVQKDLSALKMAFADAVDLEIIVKSPCDNIKVPADRVGEKIHKEAFTAEELQYIFDKFPPEWSSAVRCCFETYGQRLSDIVNLNWSQFDWERRVVCFETGKNGRVLAQPMRDVFYEWARERWEESGCPKTGLLHPRLARHSAPSYEFTSLLRMHGIGMSIGSAEGNRRSVCNKSFHSIRATCATLLHLAGVSEGMAMELVGHNSKDVHRVYLKPTTEQLRESAQGLPDIK